MLKITRAEVARVANVAESTVSRALQDSPLISEPVKKHIQTVARELGYIPSRQAALFAQKRTYTIGYVVPYYGWFPPFSRTYFSELLDGLILQADELGYLVTIIMGKSPSTIDYYVELIKSRTVDGLIFAVTPSDFELVNLKDIEHNPFVLVNNYLDGFSSVDALAETGMRKAFQHAADLGHYYIGYITGDKKYKNGIDRLHCFENFACEFHMKTQIVEGNFSQTSGYVGASFLLSAGFQPSLLMTSSDRAAFGVMRYVLENNLSVPQDVSVIGYDDFYTARSTIPSLTTIHHPISELGKKAVNMLVDIIENRQTEYKQLWLDTDFSVRKSTGVNNQ